MKLLHVLIILTVVLAVANVAGWIHINWWVLTIPLALGLVLIIAIGLMFLAIDLILGGGN